MFNDLVVAATLLALASCAPSDATEPPPSAEARSWWEWHDAKGATDDAVLAALNGPQGADYPKAVAIIRSSGRPPSVIDLQLGELIASAYDGSKSAVPPRESLSEGIRLLEKAALGKGEGAQRAPSALQTIFRRGLGTPSNRVMEADPEIAACWLAVEEDRPEDPRRCIALRLKRMRK